MGKGFLLGFVLVAAATFLGLDHVLAARSDGGRPSLIARLAGGAGAATAGADPAAVASVADRDTVGRLTDAGCDTRAGTKFCGAGD